MAIAEVIKSWLGVKRLVNTAVFFGFLENLTSSYCRVLSDIKEDIAALEGLRALNNTL